MDFNPDAKDQFVIAEGRYYSLQFFIGLPPKLSCFGKGGDITGMVWRMDSNPGEWFLQYRFRYYRDSKAFDSADEKHWYFLTLEGKEEGEILSEINEILSTIAQHATNPRFGCDKPLTVHRMEIHGGAEKFYEIIQKNPPFWLHQQQVVAE